MICFIVSRRLAAALDFGLACNTKRGIGQRFEALGADLAAAARADAVGPLVQTLERRFDLGQQILGIVPQGQVALTSEDLTRVVRQVIPYPIIVLLVLIL